MARIVTDYLDETVKMYPEKIAFADEYESITYKELKERAYKIASRLASYMDGKHPVAVCLGQSVAAIVSFLGIAYAGDFYTPIDDSMPVERIKKIIKTLEPKCFIVGEEFYKNIKAFLPEDIRVIIYEECIKDNYDIDLVEKRINTVIDTDPLYVLFTSGSTGTPKGVIIAHKSVIDYIDWVHDTFKLTSESILGNQAPFYFDNSVLDIYATIRSGATNYIIPRKHFIFPVNLVKFVSEKHINTVFWVPSVLVQLVNFDLLNEYDISCLRTILFAGEVMPAKHLNVWRRCLPDAVFANLYGPTEITVDCTYYIVNREIKDDEPVPIGVPCKNSDVIVLNDANNLVKAGEKGELCVRGKSLSYGYYNDKKKTDEVFVQNPLNQCYYEKIYRTGDIVHYNEFGELIYDGRKDFQIKHLGHRIELGEIETVTSSLPEVEINCCLYNAEKDCIVLFFVGKIPQDDVRKRLRLLLPEYMIPNKYIQMETMPLNANGKIDRVKLKTMLD